MFHARYRSEGGEERSFEEEAKLLELMGYVITRVVSSNANVTSNLRGGLSSIFSFKHFFETLRVIIKTKPDFIYANNLWPGISSSPIAAARIMNVPVLQAVRNYRLVTPSAKLDAQGACTDCHGGKQVCCVRNGCYNNSSVQSGIVLLSSVVNRVVTSGWGRHRYLATSSMTRDLVIQGGLPRSRVSVRPNFSSALGEPSFTLGSGVIFVGRLTKEKGLPELLSSWPSFVDCPLLTIVGDGPLRQLVLAACLRNPKIKWVGHVDKEGVTKLLKSSRITIIPSTWAEPFGRVAIESMSVGTPVACTGGGALEEIVGKTGVVLENLDVKSIAQMLSIASNPKELLILRRACYRRFLRHYTTESAVVDMKKHLVELEIE